MNMIKKMNNEDEILLICSFIFIMYNQCQKQVIRLNYFLLLFLTATLISWV